MMQIDIDAIKKHKLFIATPMYGGQATSNYTGSLADLCYILGKMDMHFEWQTICNESLVPRARNRIVRQFLKSECDYFFFIDSDIGFNWQDAVKMIEIMATSDKKIISATYPKKEIKWDKLHNAYQEGAIKNSNDAKNYSASFVVNFINTLKEHQVFDVDKPLKVLESGTGFMLIHREVFDAFKKAYPEQYSIEPDTKEELFCFFDCKIDPDTKVYLSEDYMFCRYAGKIGYDVWLLPWVNLTHTGTYVFDGSFEEHSKVYYKITNKQKTE